MQPPSICITCGSLHLMQCLRMNILLFAALQTKDFSGLFRKQTVGVHWHLQLALETPVQAPYTRTWLRANPNCTSSMGPWPETTESRTGGAQWKAHLKHCVSISEPPTYPTAVHDPRFRIPCDYSANANHDVKIIFVTHAIAWVEGVFMWIRRVVLAKWS